ncbi:HD domain-containing protein [candidate division WOR-3 bacterium]|nr:HD domain-containing protein [candidate division WOR-3 bacterium]
MYKKRSEDFQRSVDFTGEIDRLKSVFRHTYIFDGSRHENSAEHSWHLAVMAMVFEKFSNRPIDVLKVIKMVLIHDLVEIDAGDYILYTDKKDEKRQKEETASKRIFGLLPENLKDEFMDIWLEFEERKTAEARFATAIDRLEPIMQNHATEGKAWRENGIKKDQVIEANQHIAEGSQALWDFALSLIDECSEKLFF